MFSQGLQHFTAEAVVPEQLLHYVTAVAGSRPLACAGFPAYLLEGHLVLVAYDAAMLETFAGGPDLEAAAARVKAATDAAARLEAVSVRQSAEAATAEGVQLRDRLCGLITKQFKVTSFPAQPFRFLTFEQGGVLIEGLKSLTQRKELEYLHSARYHREQEAASNAQ